MGFLAFVLGASAIVMLIVAATLLFKGRMGPSIAVFVLALLVGGGAAALAAS